MGRTVKGGGMERICEACNDPFTIHPKVPGQMYCRKVECQKERRRRWQQQKRATDKSYKENQAAAQKVWIKENPGYWKKYREDHQEYTERNCKLQKQRNEKRKKLKNMPAFVKSKIAKMDDLINETNLISGRYILIPADTQSIAKMDYLIADIDIISNG